MHLVQRGGVGQRERERERRVVGAEEVVGPGGGAHAARGARAGAAAAAQQHVRRLRRGVAARHRACRTDSVTRYTQYTTLSYDSNAYSLFWL